MPTPNPDAIRHAMPHLTRVLSSLPKGDMEAAADVVGRWSEDDGEFARSFDILTPDRVMVRFRPSAPQTKVFAAIERNRLLQILKGRKVWVTTAALVKGLKYCLLTEGYRMVVACQADRTVAEISDFCHDLHDGNELLSQQLMPRVKGPKATGRIRFTNGSQILFGTANSEFWRGPVTNFALVTEAAYADALGKTLASLSPAVPKGGKIVLESTANGENAYHDMWHNNQAYYKLFIGWTDHADWQSDALLPPNLSPDEIAYIRAHRLSKPRASWYVQTLREMQPEERWLFDQEHPATAELAFKVSGDRFLRLPVPVPPKAPLRPDGVRVCMEFDPLDQYAAGVDVASGSQTGDFSALVVINVTKRAVACTVEARLPVPEFVQLLMRVLDDFGQPLAVVEVNTFGLAVSNSLREAGYPQYKPVDVHGQSAALLRQFGWHTTMQTRPILMAGLYEACTGQAPYSIGDSRLADQVNALRYNSAKKVEAPKGSYDDLAVAFALACQGASQCLPPRPPEDNLQMPRGAREEAAFIAKHGWEKLKSLRDCTMPQPDFFH